MTGQIGIITGMAFEAALVSKVSKQMKQGAAAPEVRCAGMGAAGAGAAAQELVSLGAGALMSFGVAGALDPQLKAGTLVVPEQVLDGEGAAWPVDGGWRAQVLEALDDQARTSGGTLLGAAELLTTTAAKQAARGKFGAAAADMESAQIASAAHGAGLPFVVLRAVADEAQTDLPPAAAAMGADGALRMGTVLGSILRRPGQVPALIALGLKTRAATLALEQALARLMVVSEDKLS